MVIKIRFNQDQMFCRLSAPKRGFYGRHSLLTSCLSNFRSGQVLDRQSAVPYAAFSTINKTDDEKLKESIRRAAESAKGRRTVNPPGKQDS